MDYDDFKCELTSKEESSKKDYVLFLRPTL